MRKYTYQAALSLLIIFLALQHICFFALDDIPVIDHEMYHTGRVAVQSFYELKDGKWVKWLGEMFTYNGTRQPQMIGRLMGLICDLFGLNRFIMRQVNLAFYLLLVILIYYIGKELWDRKTAFWGAFLTASMPLIISHSRRGDLHFFETALFAASLLLFIKSDRFRKLNFSVLFGLVFGLTLHTHETVLLYLAILVPWLFVDMIMHGSAIQKKNLTISAIIFLPFFLIFYPAAFFYPIGKAMRLYPWHADLSLHRNFFVALRQFLEEFRQGFGVYNFIAALMSCAYLIYIRTRSRNTIKNDYYAALFTMLIILPFLAITIGNIYFKEVDTLQYLMPSYPLLGLLTARALCKIRFNLGCIAIFMANIWLWSFMSIFMVADFLKFDLKINYPEPLRTNQDTEMTSMFYPKKASLLGAKETMAYFRDIFRGQKAMVYGFRIPEKDVVNRGYFDELLINGIIEPGYSDSNPYYTDRNNKAACKKTIYLILIYKSTGDAVSVNLSGNNIFVSPNDIPMVMGLLSRYKCEVIREFYLPAEFSTKKIMVVIKGEY